MPCIPLGSGRRRLPFLLGALALALGCSHPREYVWIDDFKRSSVGNGPATIGPGDVLQVRVFNQEQLGSRTRVREDGKITLPLVNDVEAVGLTPRALAVELERRFKDLVKNPVVTVSLEDKKPATVLVVGEVVKPGAYSIAEFPGILHALVSAGGLTRDASDDEIFVVREGVTSRIRFRYDALLAPSSKAKSFKLEAGDVIVVE